MTFTQYLKKSHQWWDTHEAVRWKFKPHRIMRVSELMQTIQTPDQLHGFNMLVAHLHTAEQIASYQTNHG